MQGPCVVITFYLGSSVIISESLRPLIILIDLVMFSASLIWPLPDFSDHLQHPLPHHLPGTTTLGHLHSWKALHTSLYTCRLLFFRSQLNCHFPDHLVNAESQPSLSYVTPFIPFKAPITDTKPFLRFIASLWRQGTLTVFSATTSLMPRTSLAHSESTLKVFS